MAAPRVRRRGLTQRDRLTLTVMTLGTALLVTAIVLFNGLTPAPTEFGSVSALAGGGSPAASARSSVPSAPASSRVGAASVAAVAAPSSTLPAAPATSVAPDISPAPSTAPTDTPAPAAEPARSAGAAPAAESAVAAPAAEPAPSGEPAPGPATPVSAPARAAVAQSISIPSLGMTAPVLPVGSTAGVVDPPEDPAEVGYYTGSVLPGSPAGSTVIVGHVNYANVPGALIGLTTVNEGDTVQVAILGGRTLEYRITAREVFEKSEGLPADLFVTDGPARLVLITCGGPFDTVAQRYEDNVVVVATPVS